MADHIFQQTRTNSAKAAQDIAKYKQNIAKIYQHSKSEVAQLISKLLCGLDHPISGQGDLEGILSNFSALVKSAPEFGKSHHKSAEVGGSMGMSAIPSPQEIASDIKSLLADGVNSFDEIGQILRLVGMAGGALPPELIGKIKTEVKSFLKQTLGSGGGHTQDAIHLLNQIKSMGGGAQVKELIKAIEEMIKQFLEKNDDQTRTDLLSHISNIASDKMEAQLNDVLDTMTDNLQPIKADKSNQL